MVISPLPLPTKSARIRTIHESNLQNFRGVRPATSLDILKFVSVIMADRHEHLTSDTSIFNTWIRFFEVSLLLLYYSKGHVTLVGHPDWSAQQIGRGKLA